MNQLLRPFFRSNPNNVFSPIPNDDTSHHRQPKHSHKFPHSDETKFAMRILSQTIRPESNFYTQ